jgi:hypothetical protein
MDLETLTIIELRLESCVLRSGAYAPVNGVEPAIMVAEEGFEPPTKGL